MQIAEDWTAVEAALTETAQRLLDGGAAAVAIVTNLMHKCAPAIETSVGAPFIHTVDSIATMAKRKR